MQSLVGRPECTPPLDRRYRELDLENTPILVLMKTPRLRSVVCDPLNQLQLIPTDDGLKRDYRGLSELFKLPNNEVRNLELRPDPMLDILRYLNGLSKSTDSFANHSNQSPAFGTNGLNNYIASTNGKAIVGQRFVTVELLVQALEKLDRFDVIDDLLDELRGNPIDVSENKDLAMLMQNPIKEEELIKYDAYVSYVDSDLPFVQELCNYLEGPDINLRLFIRGRDLLMGSLEYADFTELMAKQCDKLLLILSPEFLESAECEFQMKFTVSLQISERQRRLIPIIHRGCELPPIIKYFSKIDLSRGSQIPNWTWQKLVTSLLNDNQRLKCLPAPNNVSQSRSLSIHTLNSSSNCSDRSHNANSVSNVSNTNIWNRYVSNDPNRSDPNRNDSNRLNVQNALRGNSSSNSIHQPNEREAPKIKVPLEADFSTNKMNSSNDRTSISTVTTRTLTTTQSFSGEDTQALIEKQKGFKLFSNLKSKLWKNISSKIK